MIRRPPRSTQSRSSATSDVYKRQPLYAHVIRLARELRDDLIQESLVTGPPVGLPAGEVQHASVGELRGKQRVHLLLRPPSVEKAHHDGLSTGIPVVLEGAFLSVRCEVDVISAAPVSYTHLR